MKLKLICLILILSNSIYAQQSKLTDVKWGDEIDMESRSSRKLIGQNNEGFFFSKNIKGECFVEKFDPDLKHQQLFKFEEEDPNTNVKYNFHKFLFCGERLYLLKSSDDKKSKTTTLFAEEINQKTMTSGEKLIKISEMQTLEYYFPSLLMGFNFISSPDNNFLMIVKNPAEWSGKNQQADFQMFDNSMTQIWKKRIEFPAPYQLFAPLEIVVGNDGNFFLQAAVFDKVLTNSNYKKVKTEYHVFAVTNSGNTMQDIIVGLENKTLSGMKIIRKDNGDFFIAGFFSNTNVPANDGAFFMTIDHLTQKTNLIMSKEFDLEFKTQFMTHSQEKKAIAREETGKDSKTGNYIYCDIVFRPDGKVILIGEEFYTTTSIDRNAGGGGVISRNYGHFNDLTFVCLETDGKISWSKKIPKREVYSYNQRKTGTSFTTVQTEARVFLFYKDHRDNLDFDGTKNLREAFDWENSSEEYMATLNENGALTTEYFLDDGESEINIDAQPSFHMKNKGVLVNRTNKTKEQLGIVTFK